MPAQITLAAEDYNRLVRMSQHGENLKMAVDSSGAISMTPI